VAVRLVAVELVNVHHPLADEAVPFVAVHRGAKLQDQRALPLMKGAEKEVPQPMAYSPSKIGSKDPGARGRDRYLGIVAGELRLDVGESSPATMKAPGSWAG